MADVKINFQGEGIDDLLKVLKQIASQINKIQEKNIISDDEELKAKKLALEAKKIENQMERLETQNKKRIDKLNQEKGIIGSLEKEVRDLTKQWKSAGTEAEKLSKKAKLDNVKKQLTDAKNTTASWGKALGSFQFKFNALGNIAANVLSGMTNKLKTVTKEFISLDKIIKSNQVTADNYDKKIASLKGGFEALNRAIALGDYEDLADSFRRGADAAQDYVLALDVLGDTQRALNVQNERARREVRELQEVYNDTSQESEKRLEAATKAQSILNDLQSKQEEIAKKTMKAEIDRVKTTFALTEEQSEVYQRFLENYGLLTDEQITSLEGLESVTLEAVDSEKKIGKARRQSALAMAAMARTGVANTNVQESFNETITEQQKNLADYNKVAKELSDTFGFDVKPIMEAIIGTNDEQRQSIVDSIIAYDQQIGATQRLINANVAMIGSIKNSRKEIDELPSIVEAIIGTPEDIEAAIADIESSSDKIMNSIIAKQNEASGILKNNKITESNLAAQEELKIEEQKEEQKQAIISSSFATISNIAGSLATINMNRMDAELAQFEGNEAKQAEIRKKYAKKDQNIAVAEAIINGAQGVTEIWSKWASVPPVAATLTALTVGSVGAQIAAIKSQKFEKGGLIGGALHSQGGTMIEAERGEYVINRRSTSKYKDLLDGINENDQIKIMSALDKDRAIPVIKPDPWTRKMYEHMIKQKTYGETNEYFIIEKGNQTIKIRKN